MQSLMMGYLLRIWCLILSFTHLENDAATVSAQTHGSRLTLFIVVPSDQMLLAPD